MQRAKILIIEDNPDLMEVLTEYFGLFNFKTIGLEKVSDIKEIVRLQPDILLLDLDLALLKGLDILRSINENNFLRFIPLLLITACDEFRYLDKSQNVQGLFIKPFDLNEILRRAQKLLDRKNQEWGYII